MVRISLIFLLLSLISVWEVFPQSNELSRRDFIKMWKDYKKGELSFGVDTVYLTKREVKVDTVKQIVAIQVPKERIVHRDTCLTKPSRKELRYDYKKAKLRADNQVRLATLALKKEREERRKEKSQNNFVIDSLKNILYMKEVSSESMVDSLTLVTKAATKQSRIENKTKRSEGGTLFQRILRGLTFLVVLALGIFIGKRIL